MADFKKAFELMLTFEFNNPKNALHKNPTESGLTFMGIYEKAHPNWQGWEVVRATLRTTRDIVQASTLLYNDAQTRALVAKFYRDNFWNAMRGDEINSQHIANEIFCFAVNVGVKTAIKTAQKALKQLGGVATDGLAVDGKMGVQTLTALNYCDVDKFSREFDIKEKSHYMLLIHNNPKLKIYLNGWIRRAEAI